MAGLLNTLQISRVAKSTLADYYGNRERRIHRDLAYRQSTDLVSGNVYGTPRRDKLQRSAAGTDLAALDTLTGPGSGARRVEIGTATGSYHLVKYRLESVLPDEVIRAGAATATPVIERTTRRLVSQLEADLELLAQRILLDNDLYPTAGTVTLTTGAAGTSWAAASYASANTDPLGIIRAACDHVRKSTGYEANTFAATSDLVDLLADHPAIGGNLKYTSSEYLTVGTPGQIRSLRVLRMGAVYDSAPTATTPVPAYTFRDVDNALSCALICYIGPGVHPLTWLDGVCPTQGGHDIQVRAYRDEATGATIIDAECFADMSLSATDEAGKILGAYLVEKAIC